MPVRDAQEAAKLCVQHFRRLRVWTCHVYVHAYRIEPLNLYRLFRPFWRADVGLSFGPQPLEENYYPGVYGLACDFHDGKRNEPEKVAELLERELSRSTGYRFGIHNYG